MKTIIKGSIVSCAEQGMFGIIVHGCNCFCTMGSGVAKQIRSAFPGAYKVDCATKKGDINKLGTYSFYEARRTTIVNAYTQYAYGTEQQQVSYDAIREVFKAINENFPQYKTIAYPKIGAGLGGGDWEVISAIIDKELGRRDHTLIVL